MELFEQDPGGGPLKGANLLVVLIDQAAQLDPEGKPESPFSLRAAAFGGLSKLKDGDAVRVYMFRVFITDGKSACEGESVAAEIDRDYARSGPANGGRNVADEWKIAPSEGGELTFTLSYKTRTRNYTSGASSPYCATNPDYFETNRYEQMVDLVMSEGIGKPISGTFELTSSVPELSKVFDGSEEVLAILDPRVDVRRFYLP